MNKPVVFVIFGLTGDLAQRKLLPALDAVLKDGRLHPDSRIVGVSRRQVAVADVVRDTPDLQPYVAMAQADLADPADYRRLDEFLDQYGDVPRLYYLSVPPESYSQIIANVSPNGRLLIEKPFGSDVASAEQLDNLIHNRFDEADVYRVDHYLAKAQLLRFEDYLRQNPLHDVAAITITAYETLSIEGRAAFYDKVGALRDLVESHLLQVLSVITTMPATDQHQARQEFLEHLSIALPAERGQYQGYTADVGQPASTTETFARLYLGSTLRDWKRNLFTLQSGKSLQNKQTTIEVEFENGQTLVADLTGQGTITAADGSTHSAPAGAPLPDAYETVFLEAAAGRHDLFSTSAEILAAWRVVQPVLDTWQGNDDGLKTYPQGAAAVT